MPGEDVEARAEKRGASPEGRGRNPRVAGGGASNGAARMDHSGPETLALMEAVVGRENMWSALKRVESNKGAPGVDDMPVSEFRCYLREHWPRIKEELLDGRDVPSPVRKVEIPKPGGKQQAPERRSRGLALTRMWCLLES